MAGKPTLSSQTLCKAWSKQGEQLGKEAHSKDTIWNTLTKTGPSLQVAFLWSVVVALVASMYLGHLPKS